jgi:predicted RNase H-like HicB family nuclease
MARDIEDYIQLRYAVEVVPDSTTDGMPCYRASHPELPGCMAHGETPDEALDNLEDAKRLYIETLLVKGLEVPLPTTAAGVIWTILREAAAAASDSRRDVLRESRVVERSTSPTATAP